MPVLDSSEVASADAEGVFAGLDWGNSQHQLCVLDARGKPVHQGSFAHDVAGLDQLESKLRAQGTITGIAIERAEGLLVERLQDQGHRLFCVSPKMSARARERYRLAPSKSDVFDAFVPADSLRHEHRHWRPLAVPSALLAELRALTRDRERLVSNQRDVENQLSAVVLAYHPAVLALFSSLDRDICLSFLRDYPTPAQASRVGTARMAAFCSRHGYSGRTPPEVLAGRLRASLLAGSPGTVSGKHFTALMFAEQLELLNAQVRAVTRQIRSRLAAHPDAASDGEDRTLPIPGNEDRQSMVRPLRSTLTVALVESPVPGRLARRVRRATRGNGPGATLAPRPGPTPHLPARLQEGLGCPQAARQAGLYRGERRCRAGGARRARRGLGQALPGGRAAVGERLGGVHPVPGLRRGDPARHLPGERDRVPERPVPAGDQGPRPLPD
jgi:hypothetical protein